jgi:uncharacterized protein YbjT (DUF2867 family)
MIVVFGSTGTVGRLVVNGLVAAGERVRAFTRDPARATFGPGVEVVAGDLQEIGTVRAALAGADGVFVATSPDALAHELTLADALRDSGAGRVVKLSSVAANPPVTDSYGGAHADAEKAFMESGAEWTALRPAGFMSNVMQWKKSIKSQGRVYQPHGGIQRAVIDPEDVAAVAVSCLTTPGHHEKAYQLTGPEALSAPQLTAKVSAVLRRPLQFVEVDPEQARNGMIGAGMPPQLVEGLLASMADPGALRGGTPMPTVQQITGRSPATFDSWLARHVAELRD